MTTDFLKIESKNSYGDYSKKEFVNPTCKEAVNEFVETLYQLGFSPYQVYSTLSEKAELIKEKILS